MGAVHIIASLNHLIRSCWPRHIFAALGLSVKDTSKLCALEHWHFWAQNRLLLLGLYSSAQRVCWDGMGHTRLLRAAATSTRSLASTTDDESYMVDDSRNLVTRIVIGWGWVMSVFGLFLTQPYPALFVLTCTIKPSVMTLCVLLMGRSKCLAISGFFFFFLHIFSLFF
jgi:hypothetical protein